MKLVHMIGIDNVYLLHLHGKKHEHVNNIDITWMQITIWMKLNSLKFIALKLLSMVDEIQPQG
jgi:hypothetical protein